MQPKTIVLYPFGFKHFNSAIDIINRYFNCYKSVCEEYDAEVQSILGNKDYDEATKQAKLKYYNNSYDEVGNIARAVLASTESSLAEDIEAMIGFCCRQEINLEDFHWGEVGLLLATAIEVNMDFFAQNKDKISLIKKVEESPSDGEKKSAS